MDEKWEMHTKVWYENLMGKDHLGHLHNIKIFLRELQHEGVDWIQLDHDRVKW
jgi:hypothetical protein